jgi:hypothetical protein
LAAGAKLLESGERDKRLKQKKKESQRAARREQVR